MVNKICLSPASYNELARELGLNPNSNSLNRIKIGVIHKIQEWWKDEEIKEHKMTREEAIKKVMNNLYEPNADIIGGPKTKPRAADIVAGLEALGLLKFEEKINKLFEITENNILWPAADLSLEGIKKFNSKYGAIRLEEWPEGLVLWVGGEIVWKSWIAYGARKSPG